MNVLRLTAKHFKQSDSYWKDYIGKMDITDYDGHIEIDGGLGYVKFPTWLRAKGSIIAKAGTDIKAGKDIKAGGGIKVGGDIEAGEDIKAGNGIEAGKGIKARWSIEGGWSIKAGNGIEAGEYIKARNGIKAGLAITCKLSIVATTAVFAGICYWKKASDEEKTITCSKLYGGATVEYGILKETGMQESSLAGKVVSVNIDGKEYKAVIQ